MFQPFAAVEVAVDDEMFRRDTESPPANVEVADDVATKYCAPKLVASTPAANVEVAVPLMAMERDEVGARSPPAFNSNALPKMDEATSLKVGSPKDDVASCCHEPPPYAPSNI